MRFTNENGDTMTLADNLTLHELLDMGVSISVCEETDPISRSGWQNPKTSSETSQFDGPPSRWAVYFVPDRRGQHDPLVVPQAPFVARLRPSH